MAGQKQTYEIELNPNQMGFIKESKDKYNIADESKAVRIVMDYLMTNPGLHDTVFDQVRCLRCE